MEREGNRSIREGIKGWKTNSKGHLGDHMETYYCTSFLKYIKKNLKWKHQIMGRTMLQLDHF